MTCWRSAGCPRLHLSLAEGLAGLLVSVGVPGHWLSVPIALFIGTVGAVSVFRAVYIDKRELKCACVGGSTTYRWASSHWLKAEDGGMAGWMGLSALGLAPVEIICDLTAWSTVAGAG